jgi:hypothetical protein
MTYESSAERVPLASQRHAALLVKQALKKSPIREARLLGRSQASERAASLNVFKLLEYLQVEVCVCAAACGVPLG